MIVKLGGASRIAFPESCCCCGGPAEGNIELELTETDYGAGYRYERSCRLEIPGCVSCRHHAWWYGPKGRFRMIALAVLIFIGGTVAGLLGSFGRIIRGDYRFLAAAAAISAAAAAGYARWRMKDRPGKLGPEHAGRVPAWIEEATSSYVALGFARQEYGEEVRRLNERNLV